MIAIIAGLLLWCLVFAMHMTGIDIGTTGTVVLVGLGAILIASSAITSFKISASGVELQTREHTAAPIQFKLPTFDYVRTCCYLIFVGCLVAAIVWSFSPSPESVWFCGTPGNCQYIRDPSSLADRASKAFFWMFVFSACAALVLMFKAKKRKHDEASKTLGS